MRVIVTASDNLGDVLIIIAERLALRDGIRIAWDIGLRGCKSKILDYWYSGCKIADKLSE